MSSGTTDVREVEGMGKCVVAARALEAGTVVGAFEKTEKSRMATPTQHTLQFAEGVHVATESSMRYLAHSSSPNARLVADKEIPGEVTTIQVVLMADVREGDVISFDYRTSEWDMSTPFVEKGSGVEIRGFKHASKEHQEALLPLCTPYIREKAAAST